MPKTLRLLIVRHGETKHNAEGRIQGHTDTPLSEIGRRQARTLGEHLDRCFRAVPPLLPIPQFVLTSDLCRASETATILIESAKLPVPIVNSLLRERSYGDWQGMLFADIRKEYDAHIDPPNGESEAQVFERMQSAFATIWQTVHDPSAETDDPTVLIVGHGGALRALFCIALGLDAISIGRFHLGNASLSEIEFVGDNANTTIGRIVRINEGGHLRQAAFAGNDTEAV